MADLTTVRSKIAEALDEADTALGQPTVTQQLADKDSQIGTLTTQLQAANDALTTANASVSKLQGKLDAVKAARQSEEAGETAADQARQQIDAALA